jgi:hypothetical protein
MPILIGGVGIATDGILFIQVLSIANQIVFSHSRA